MIHLLHTICVELVETAVTCFLVLPAEAPRGDKGRGAPVNNRVAVMTTVRINYSSKHHPGATCWQSRGSLHTCRERWGGCDQSAGEYVSHLGG